MGFRKIIAGAAALGIIGGMSIAGTLTATAATPSCGGGFIPPYGVSGCIDIFSHKFGTYHSPSFVLDVFRQGAHVGQPIILFRASNNDPAEDFVVSFQGLVSDFFAAGLVGPQVMLHYGCLPGNEVTVTGGQGGTMVCPGGAKDEPAFELEYAPYGVLTGLCAGVPGTAFQGERVSLQSCGTSARTTWILDTYDQPRLQTFINGFTFPVINGSDTNFSHPFVLDYPHSSEPTDVPRAQLQVNGLTGFSNGFGPIVGSVIDTQLWGARVGVLP